MQSSRGDQPSFFCFIGILLCAHRQARMSSDRCWETKCINPKLLQPVLCNLVFVLLISSGVSIFFFFGLELLLDSVRESWGSKMSPKRNTIWRYQHRHILERVQNQEDKRWVRRIYWTSSQAPKIPWQEFHFSSATANFSIWDRAQKSTWALWSAHKVAIHNLPCFTYSADMYYLLNMLCSDMGHRIALCKVTVKQYK